MGARRGNTLRAIVLTIVCISQGLAKATPVFKLTFDPLDKFNAFDWNITKLVGSTVKDNVLLSPISLKLVLAMLYEGAQGETSKQLQEVLDIGEGENSRYPNITKSLEVSNNGYELDIGMKLFIDKDASPKKEFAKRIKSKFNATIDQIDFSNTAKAVSAINNWAKSVTKGHIEHLVSEADTKASTVLLLLNAVYFKGLWLHPFSPKDTVEGRFITGPNKYECVDYMVGDFVLNYVESPDLKAQIIRMPYMGDKFAMYIVLPDNDTTVEAVIGKMTSSLIRTLINDMYEAPVALALPKFSFEFASSLAPILIKLGINKIFSTEAELRNIAEGSKDLVVSNVIQKAVIDVNELGTVAAAASSVGLVNKFGMQTLPFNVSRPFGFFIEDEVSRTVIFLGKVINPSDPGKGKVSAKPSSNYNVPAPQPSEQQESSKPASSSVPSEQSEPSGPALLPSQAANQTPQSSSGNRAPAKVTQPPPTTTMRTPSTNNVIAGANPLANRISSDLPLFYYFDIDLAQGFIDNEKGNWVASPVSIKTGLGLLLEGSRENTAEEISRAIRLPIDLSFARNSMHEFQDILMKPLTEPGVDVRIASRLFTRYQAPIKPSFNKIAKQYFGADVKELNYEQPFVVSKEVNSWVSQKTNNFITEIIKPENVQPNTQLLMVNVVYFKGEWKYGFDSKFTQDKFFHTPSGSKKVKMMLTSGMFKSGYLEGLNSQIIELPYKNERYSMVIILPKEKMSVSRVISNLPYNAGILSVLDAMKPQETDVILPKFTITYQIDLIPILRKLNINDVFTEKADLFDLLKAKGWVSSFIHQAKIEVNENGTVAAAATTVNVQLLSVSEKRKVVVDHPFLFFIRDAASGFLFDGQVVDPSIDEVIIGKNEETARAALPAARNFIAARG